MNQAYYKLCWKSNSSRTISVYFYVLHRNQVYWYWRKTRRRSDIYNCCRSFRAGQSNFRCISTTHFHSFLESYNCFYIYSFFFFKQGLIYIMKCFLSKIGMPPIAPALSCESKMLGQGMGAVQHIIGLSFHTPERECLLRSLSFYQ